VTKTLRRIALMSGAGLIAISATTLAATLATAAVPAGRSIEQVAEGQQQQNPPPPNQNEQNKNQKNGQQHNQQGGQPQYQQGGQQNWQNQQGGQQHNQQSGQPQYQQGGQQNWQNQQGGQQHNQQGGQPQYQQGGQQNWQNQQGGQQHNQQGGQQSQRYNWSSYQPGHRPPDWDRYHQNFDPHPYQGNWNAQHRYSWHPYVPPHGWYYRRWVYGEVLPPIFWSRDYWLDSYWQFGLIDPPYGYVWVRYGSDALLVDVAVGQILSVMYGVFYPTDGYAPSDNYAPPNNDAPPGNYPPPPMQPPAPSPVWYYCDNPQGYYPYIQSCYSAWREVPATPPGAPYSQPQ
jgi:hypothetical protein